MGAHLKSTIAFYPNENLYVSQYIGNLDNFDVYNRFIQTTESFTEIFEQQPEVILVDKHPLYQSTQYGKELANKTTENKYPKTKFKFKNSNHTMFGCGPAIYANFTILNPIKKKSIYKIELYDLTTNKITTYYQSNLQNEISIGHGMCSGAFNFIAGNKYKVRFTPMSSSGKLKKPSDWNTFKNPYKDIKNRW